MFLGLNVKLMDLNLLCVMGYTGIICKGFMGVVWGYMWFM